ncbi:ABC transporter ATP-binding protein [Streptomyces sp. PSKA54]|uniref:ABC transporter ATP-binding protein n=1 Tax=Streptomyces himalayensis subsp. aureolus TaxID=2758039 RepID=A0A7W2D5D1_9ACTN|nr:ABC transporter ATP-binding protein [Streptomyces himalayensis]MBA4865073.1 ABC transporter ATP-binding protein [Streptomyces himalayensis subsp. aureolus]
MTRAISLRNVTKTYGRNVRAVDRFTLDIAPGEFVVLLGPSGCGKSTVLRMIAGLEDITEGELLLDGERVDGVAPGERDMAMVFQNFALYPRMTNRDNISFPLRMEKSSEDPRPRVEATARMLGIEDILDRYPSQLSGGERQRVAMGRAVSRRPSCFLMDEPLSNLDAKLRNHLRAEISRLTRELGVTTVYVTHDQAEAMSLGDRVAIMRGGVLQQVSTPRDVYAVPANIFVATFIGTPRINLLEATVHAPLDGRMSIDLRRQRLPLPEPLSPDHQLLRIQQGRRIVVGLRSEAVRIATPAEARPGEVPISGLVEHMEYQGHEALVHFNTGSRPAVVADLESPRPAPAPRRRRRAPGAGVLSRWMESAGARAGSDPAPAMGPVVAVDDPDPFSRETPAPGAGRPATGTSDLVVRTSPDVQLRPGAQVPLLVDLAHLYVFDVEGRRICPAPSVLPGLDV